MSGYNLRDRASPMAAPAVSDENFARAQNVEANFPVGAGDSAGLAELRAQHPDWPEAAIMAVYNLQNTRVNRVAAREESLPASVAPNALVVSNNLRAPERLSIKYGGQPDAELFRNWKL